MTYGKIQKYNCGYCGFEFNSYAQATGGEEDQLGRFNKTQSNSIKCPHCLNFVKTWHDKTDRDVLRMNKKQEGFFK